MLGVSRGWEEDPFTRRSGTRPGAERERGLPPSNISGLSLSLSSAFAFLLQSANNARAMCREHNAGDGRGRARMTGGVPLGTGGGTEHLVAGLARECGLGAAGGGRCGTQLGGGGWGGRGALLTHRL